MFQKARELVIIKGHDQYIRTQKFQLLTELALENKLFFIRLHTTAAYDLIQ